MSLSEPQSPSTLTASPADPACGPLAVGGLLTSWFALASLLALGLASAALSDVSPGTKGLLQAVLLAGLWLIPLGGARALARRPGWHDLRTLSLALAPVAAYALLAIVIRAAAGGNGGLEAGLRLAALVPAGLLGGALLLRRWPATLGLAVPPLAGLALGLALAGLLTAGWPLTGALGDSWTSLTLALEQLAQTLPEEILFRGVVLGFLLHALPQRRLQAGLLSLAIYLVFIPSRALGVGAGGDAWGALGSIFVLAPLALLTTELRVRTGSIWAGLAVAWLYRAAPPLFTDPRDQIPEPAQWGAYGWMLLAAGGLALLLWLGRRALGRRWRLSRAATTGLTLLLAGLMWGGWFAGWALAGEPGFHNDGFIIMMAEQADLSAAYDIEDPVARRTYVYETLVRTAEETQAPIRARLEAAGLAYRPYYLINMIRVEGHHRQRGEFAALPGVAEVVFHPNVRPYPSHTALGTTPAPERRGVEWNIRRAGAEAIWKMGFRGEGVVIGGQDTGFDWEHPALKQSYRGWDAAAGQVDHRYNWHDAWDDAPAPHDDGSHGTHTMGIMVGDDGQGNQIGMAPGAQWIGCRNMRRGIGNPASYTECMEFFLAPYPPGGDPFHDGDVTRAPDVVNNSWGCPDFEGCRDDTLEPALEALRAAGLLMVVSAGNEGPACATVADPPARYDAAFSVGATDSAGQITFFSSRGPVPGENGAAPLLKPDIAAPGDEIRSSVPGGDYELASGTSMAGPHVTGLVALLWSAYPELRGDLEATERLIRQSATPVEVLGTCPLAQQAPPDGGFFSQVFAAFEATACACGDVTGVPNNVYGWGEINALRAVELAGER